MKYTLTLLSLCLLEGCAHHYDPLNIAKKERLVSELVATDLQCRVYIEKLKSSSIKDDDVDSIFHEALITQCIKKDV